ncbi:TetR family transcriptional regulator [Kineothrix alysoides]|uniref:TetR family transcriptional regulator n=1 Tax=Kineothrix alysoides TaxID=1469948 RepID=A0A4R1QR44_9FIRM|nr:TetR/AcrR family transcriptional regulator C-terminal domain-containing protein [Kineothrix alysoides]TCL55393.1 TetR family transcriptional regulator [Kineothrix alysoides]
MNPRHSKLSRELIIKEAFALLDEYGEDEFSMRNIAQRLNVKAMSLYNHVRSKEDLLDGIVEIITCEVRIPQPSADWKLDLRNVALSFYEILLRHPNVLPIISTHSPITEKGIEQVERLLLILKDTNMSGQEAFSLLHIIIAYVIGHAEISITNNQASEVRSVKFDLQKFPNVYTVYLELNKRNCKNEFLYGLDLLLDGLSKKNLEREEN